MFIGRRHIQPGYDTGRCSAQIIEQVNCLFSEQVYSRFLKKKFGVDDCREDQFSRYFIKKSLLDLDLIYDPEMCLSFICEAPCGVVVTGQTFHPISCYPATQVSVSFNIPEINCLEPTNVSADFSY